MGHFLHLDGDGTGSSYTRCDTYKMPILLGGDPNTFLAGTRLFKLNEIEIYRVNTTIPLPNATVNSTNKVGKGSYLLEKKDKATPEKVLDEENM